MSDADAVTVRPACPDDAQGIAAIHVASWRETYPGLLPAAMIAAHTVERRQAFWRRSLGDPGSGMAVRVAAGTTGLVGFGACGAQRSADLAADGFDGEISALYVLRSAQGRGVGAALMAASAAHLLQAGYRAGSLWVLRDSTVARRFYQNLGGTVIAEREEHRHRGSLVEVAYGWRVLAAIRRDAKSRPMA